MTTSLSDSGLQLASGNIIDLKTAMPTTGSYTAGDLVMESTTGARVSGWKRLTTGSGNVLGTDWAYFSDGAVLGTVQNSTSGTSIDFTSIPSWVKRITIAFNGVSTNGTSNVQVQLGNGSVVTTGYICASTFVFNSSPTLTASYTTGFGYANTNLAANLLSGHMILTLTSANTWTCSSMLGQTVGTIFIVNTAGYIVLSSALDRVRVTTVAGTDTFDAGSINILYE